MASGISPIEQLPITVTVLDCTPQVRHDNLGDRAVATTGYRALLCANTAS
ncbi:hypothetical protein ABIB73_006195, partial [Bradyrhizobium sp. F1.4.3]